MAKKITFFLSDFHLGAGYQPGPEAERRVVAFLDSIKEKAERIYLLGDILDYWYEYRYVVPKGFVRFFGKLAELTDSGVEVTWLIGNHDIWIFDYLPGELGVKVIDGSAQVNIGGKVFFLAHGDGIGKPPRYFRLMRALFRNRFCQHLYAAIHPRWTVPFALCWSRGSRTGGGQEKSGEGLKRMEQWARDWAALHPETDYFVFGHLHRAEDVDLGDGRRLVVLGDWISLMTYAEFDGEALRLRHWEG